LLFGGGGNCYNLARWGSAGGFGVGGEDLLILLVARVAGGSQ